MLALFFYKEIFLGRVFSPSDQLFTYPPWQTVRPIDYQHPSNYVRSDESFIAFPRRFEIAEDVRRYGLPLWQDHTFAGSPNTLGLHVLGGFIYPPMLGYLFLSTALATTLLHLSVPFVAALSMYLLMTRVTRFRLVSLFASLAWALNGYVIVWLSSFTLPLTVGIMPLLIYLAWRFLEERRIIFGASYAVLIGCSLFLAYAPANIIVLAGVAVFGGAWMLGSPRPGVRPLAWLAGLTLLGLGIGGLGLLTDVSQLGPVAAQQFRGEPTPLPFKNLQTFFFPNVYGNPTAVDWRGTFGNYCENIAYAGGLTMVLAVAWVLLTARRGRRPDPLSTAALAIGSISFALAYAIWPFSLIERLPVLSGVRPARWQIGIVFAGIVLAAMTLDAIGRRAMPRWPLAAGAGVVGVVAVALLLVHRRDFGGADGFITADYVLRVAILALGAAGLLLLWQRPGAVLALVAGLLAIDLFSFGVDFNPAISPAELYPPTPAIALLRAHAQGYRVLAALRGGGLWPGDVLNVYGVDTLTGYDHLRDESFIRLLGANMSPDEVAFWRTTGYLTLGSQLHLEDPVFGLLNVKDVYLPNQDRPSTVPAGWHSVYTGRDGTILERDQPLPKQFVVSGAQLSPVDHLPAAPDHDQLNAAGPGLLVWSKPYSPDWQVTVNGRSRPAVRYENFFLAVPLDQGTNTVSVAYRPRVYYLGAALSGLSLLGLIALVFALSRRRRQASAQPPVAGRKKTWIPSPIHFPPLPSRHAPR